MPKKDNNTFFIGYFIIFIFIGSLFLLNLFIGVIFLNYRLAEKKAKDEALTDEHYRWIEL
jgi:hypothetical protein